VPIAILVYAKVNLAFGEDLAISGVEHGLERRHDLWDPHELIEI